MAVRQRLTGHGRHPERADTFDGRLDHLITGDLDDNYQETEQVVMRWMSQGRDYQQPE